MRIDVGGGVRLFVDVDGAEWVPDGDRMVRRPTLVLLHGGPGMDHSSFKTELAGLRDVAQLVYLDHRGNGRSDDGPRGSWTLAQWGDDVRTVCDALGLERPIVLGQSFGGFVAQSYATRHPGHAAGVIFSSTAARRNEARNLAVFERLGGARARQAAEAFYADPGERTLRPFVRHCMSLYNRGFSDPGGMKRTLLRLDVLFHFFAHEYRSFDLLPDLPKVRCPVLVLGGEDDPTTPIDDQEDIVAALPPELVEYHRFPGCGHGVWRDAPERAMPILRDFVARCAPVEVSEPDPQLAALGTG
ncbi:MAG TPA: alpha/beta hydrolase [Myxococcota bacterium]|nr:alpha/beta hydrolase [Myxococcota bacterium]